MLRDVNVSVTDGGLISTSSGAGIHVKIGVSPVAANDLIAVKGTDTAARIRELLGYSPLADAAMDSVANGSSLLYCLPVVASVEGAVGAVTGPENAVATVAVAGKPNNRYSLVIEITKGGGLNEAGLRYSINGGLTYSAPQTMPLGGTLAIPATGLTATFTPGEGDGFQAGAVYRVSTTAPTLSNADLLGALAKLRTWRKTFEYIHVVGTSGKALWAACAAEAALLEQQYHKPLYFVFEAPDPTGDAAAYKAALATERAGCDSKYIQVVTARGLYKRLDGTTQDINLAGVICGLYSRAAVHQSIGEVRSFGIPETALTQLLPAGIEEHISDLDDLGYLTVRRYDGLSGYYVNNARMFAPEGSDYQYAERVRVTNKIIREVRSALLSQLQIPVDIGRLDVELSAIAEFAKVPLDKMAEAGEITSARIIVPTGQDLLTSESLSIIIRYVPVGYVREISVELGMENPLKEA